MPDLATLRSLLARVEAADRPSNELDARILCALFAPSDAHVEKSQINGRWCIYHGTDRSGKPRLFDKPRDVPNDIWISNISASIDAVVGLIELVWPGWGWAIERTGQSFNGAVWDEYDFDGAGCRSAPSALLVAFLRALIAKEEAHVEGE